MSFLQPWILWGLPVILIPVIIHLLNRIRHRTVEWGAMLFLLEAAQRTRRRTKLRHFLILAMRVLAVAGLVFALSRPLASGWLGLFGGTPDTVIVLLDRSASMAQQDLQTGVSKRSSSLRQIVDLLNTTGAPAHLVLIDSATGNARELDTAASLLELPETWPSDGAANLPALLETAHEYIVANTTGSTDIWVCSDLQRADWRTKGGQWSAIRDGFSRLKQDVRFHLLAYRGRPAENLSARVTSVERVITSDSAHLILSVEGHREGGGGRRDVPLEVVVDGARSVIQVAVTGPSFALEGHQLTIDGANGLGWGRIELPNDANPRDNVFYFTYGEEPIRQTVVVTDRPRRERVLALAAAPPDDDLRAAATVVRSDEIATVDWSEVALVLWQAPLPDAATAEILENFVSAGGLVMFFPAEGDTGHEVFGCRWTAWEEAPAGKPFRVQTWRDDSGLVSDTASGVSLPLSELEVLRTLPVEGPGRALARLVGNRPLLHRAPTERGAVYFATTRPFDDSNLARQGVVFVVMVQRALAEGSTRLGNALSSTIGDETPASPTASPGSDWEQIDGWPEGALSTQAEYVAGVYRLGERLVSRNRPLAEDSTGVLDNADLETAFGDLDYRVVEGRVSRPLPLVEEVWRLFIVALVLCLFLEALLCLPNDGRKNVPA